MKTIKNIALFMALSMPFAGFAVLNKNTAKNAYSNGIYYGILCPGHAIAKALTEVSTFTYQMNLIGSAMFACMIVLSIGSTLVSPTSNNIASTILDIQASAFILISTTIISQTTGKLAYCFKPTKMTTEKTS